MGTGRSGRSRDELRQSKRGRIEHSKLPVQQIDQLWAVLDVRSHDANALVSVEVAKNFGRAICQGHLIVASRGEQPGDGGAYFAGADHDDIFHTLSGHTKQSVMGRSLSTVLGNPTQPHDRVGQGSIQVSIRYKREPRICGANIRPAKYSWPIWLHLKARYFDSLR